MNHGENVVTKVISSLRMLFVVYFLNTNMNLDENLVTKVT